jgi:hypothetical protein
MKRPHWIVIAALGIAMMIPAAAAFAADTTDGTGGPDQATPDATACDRTLLDQPTIASIIDGTPGIYTGELQSVDELTDAGGRRASPAHSDT